MTRGTLIAVTTAALALPAVASADTFCVGASCPAGPNTKTTLQGALDAANTNGSGTRDRIEVYGSLPAANSDVASGNLVDIIGTGPTSSVITGVSGSTNVPVLRVRESSSTVSSLGVRIPAAPTRGGLELEGAAATNVDVAPAVAGSSPNGVVMSGSASLSRSTVSVGTGTAVSPTAAAGQTAVVEDTRIAGYNGLFSATNGGGRVVARRLDISSSGYGVFTIGSSGTTSVTSTRIVMTAGATAAMDVRDAPSSPVLDVRGITAIGATGVAGVRATSTSPSVAPRAHVRDTILRGFSVDLERKLAASLDVRYSDFDPSKISDDQSPSGIDFGPGNVNVDPGFVPGGTALAPTSPLIDAGDPAAFDAFTSETDLAGAPRPTDGNGDGVPRDDIGASEYQRPAGTGPPPPPARDTVAPALSGVRLTASTFRVGSKSTAVTAARRKRPPKGTTLRYRLSEAATVRVAVERRAKGARIKRGNKRVCVKRTRSRRKRATCTRYEAVKTLRRTGKAGANSLAFSGRIAKKALKPGSYRLRLTATDAAGNRSATRTLRFKIVR